MRSIRNFKEKICSFENIERAYRNARKGRRYKKEVLTFTDKLEENLFSIKEELESMEYRGGEYYEFLIHEPKARLIMAQNFRHRVIQWAIYQVIFPEMQKGFIKDSYACIEEKGTMRAVHRLQYWVKRCWNIEQDAKRKGIQKKYYYAKFDIEKFFNTVNHELSVNIHAKKTGDTIWSRYIFETIFNPPDANFGLPYGKDIINIKKEERLKDRGMPIGNILSQENANVNLNVLDQYCKHVLKIKMYIRYMDDIVIIHEDLDKIKEFKEKIDEFIQQELKLRLNNKKTKINKINQGIDFCGYYVRAHRITIRKSSCIRMKRNLKKKMKEYKEGKTTIESITRTLAAYDGILQHCDSTPLKKAIYGYVDNKGNYIPGWFVLTKNNEKEVT